MSFADDEKTAEDCRLEAADAAGRGEAALAVQAYKQFLQRRQGVSTLFIGDSHVSTFSDVPNAAIIWLGAITMHRVRRDAAALIRVSDLPHAGIKSIVFMFGEIDCRNHIHVQAEAKQVSIELVIDDLVTGYLAAIGKIVAGVNAKIIVCTPPAPHDIPPYSPSYELVRQILEPLDVRVDVTARVAQAIQNLAPKHGYAVLDLYGHTAGEDGVMIETFNDDDIHVYSAEGCALASDLFKKVARRNPLLKFLGFG